jgi:hypothetical protein
MPLGMPLLYDESLLLGVEETLQLFYQVYYSVFACMRSLEQLEIKLILAVGICLRILDQSVEISNHLT